MGAPPLSRKATSWELHTQLHRPGPPTPCLGRELPPQRQLLRTGPYSAHLTGVRPGRRCGGGWMALLC